MMKECRVIQITTPSKLVLNGLWFGPNNAKRVVIFVHGLTSNAFSGHDLVLPLVDECTAIITFSNRGNGKIVRMKRIDERKKKGYTSVMIGEAHEKFTDCADDLQGVIDYIHSKQIYEIFLVGHSTGCQKSIYYLSRKGKQKSIKGVVLLAPMSDYAGALYQDKDNALLTITDLARDYCRKGKEHALLPLDIWPMMHDAQRFLSLYTPDSEEELFCYCQKNKIPKTYQMVKIPQLILLGEKDESRDRSMKKIAKWFERNSQSRDTRIEIIKKAPHSFFLCEERVVAHIKAFIKKNSL